MLWQIDLFESTCPVLLQCQYNRGLQTKHNTFKVGVNQNKAVGFDAHGYNDDCRISLGLVINQSMLCMLQLEY